MNQTENPLGSKPLPQLLRTFAIPSVLAMLVSSLYNIVDQIFIGQGVGYLGNAATNVAYPLTTICMSIALLIGIGSAARFNLSLGAGESAQARRTVGSAVTMMVVLGVFYAVCIELFATPLLDLFGATPDVLPYALSYTRITAVGMPLLIIINGMSNLARAASCVMGLAYLKRFRSIRLTAADFGICWDEWRRIAALGLSNSFNQLAMKVVQIVLNNSLKYYGALSIYGSEIPLATSGIVIKINAILTSVIVGISQGAQPIISFNYGAGQYARVRGTYSLAIRISLAVSAVGFAAFQIFPRQIVSLFGTGDQLYFEFGVRFMRCYLLMVMINCVQLLSSNFFAAIGKPVRRILLSLTRQVFFLVPLLLILPLFLGMDGILYAAPVADFIAFVTSVVVIRKELRSLKTMENH